MLHPSPNRPAASAALATVAAATADALVAVAGALLFRLETGTAVETAQLRVAMQEAFGGTDAEGAWDWKTAYDACEAAQVLFLRRHGSAIFRKSDDPQVRLRLIERVAGLLPSQTRRSEAGQALQQFSTPAALAYVVGVAAAVRPGELVLEPSAGTGLLAIQAEIAGGGLVLNELAETRAALLARLFPHVAVSDHDAAQIDDHLDPALAPGVVMMNPPFSAVAHVDRRVKDAAYRHIASALSRLTPGGRLVTITGGGFAPDAPAWGEAFASLAGRGALLFSAAIDGRAYARHGTTMETRLTVFERRPDAAAAAPVLRGAAPDVATLLAWVLRDVPPRAPMPPTIGGAAVPSSPLPRAAIRLAGTAGVSIAQTPSADVITLDYACVDWTPPQGERLSDAIYEPFELQSVSIAGALPHPTKLVQSAAMASVAPPKPSYRPQLPANLVADGILSDAQLESVIYAGEAHAGYLTGAWRVDDSFDALSAIAEDAEGAVRFRRGWFCGDGTGCGKGREVAGIILDNWLQGRRRALWVSLSDKLLEDAQRDWRALGQEPLLVTPLARFRQGTPIRLDAGVLFTTYATLRSQERGEKASRIQQIIDWLGRDFDGVIVFDEAHAMANAAGGRTERGEQAASQQGRAGLRLQHALPHARIIYVSATGAVTVQNLAYAERLGLWLGEDFPFATCPEFVAAIEDGGVAAMEVVARDLKALGLYSARSLSFDGVEYELLEHELTAEQVRIYDAYAGAFEILCAAAHKIAYHEVAIMRRNAVSSPHRVVRVVS